MANDKDNRGKPPDGVNWNCHGITISRRVDVMTMFFHLQQLYWVYGGSGEILIGAVIPKENGG